MIHAILIDFAFTFAVACVTGTLTGLWLKFIRYRPAVGHTGPDGRHARPPRVPPGAAAEGPAPCPRLGAGPPLPPLYAPRHDGLIRVGCDGRISVRPRNGVNRGTMPRRPADTRAERVLAPVRPYLDKMPGGTR